MKHTVVGLFDRHADAETAANALALSGIDRGSLHLTDSKATELLAPSTVIEGGTGVTGRLADLFANLFGLDDKPHAGQYAEAVRRGGTVLRVEVDDEIRVPAVTQALKSAGAVDIDDRLGDWTQGGWDSGGTASQDAPADTQTRLAGSEPVPKGATEWLAVHRQVVSSGGVRVYSSTAVHGYDDYANEFRADHASRYGSQGGSYDDYDAAYRHGHAMASDSRYRGRSWDEVEADAERNWLSGNQSGSWQKIKDAVRHAWERVGG